MEGYVYLCAKIGRKENCAGQRRPEANQYHKSQRRIDFKATEKSRTN